VSTYITRGLGVAGSTIAVLAAVASLWAATLPYRLSPEQGALLHTAGLIQLAGLVLGPGFGIVALRGDARTRRLGLVGLAFSGATLAFVIFTHPAHSTSRW
jgi:hypothetical protein